MGYRLRLNPRNPWFALTPVALQGGDKPATDVAEKRANQSDPLDKKADGRLTTDRVSPVRHKQTHPPLSGESFV